MKGFNFSFSRFKNMQLTVKEAIFISNIIEAVWYVVRGITGNTFIQGEKLQAVDYILGDW